jgi:hypothetical protein
VFSVEAVTVGLAGAGGVLTDGGAVTTAVEVGVVAIDGVGVIAIDGVGVIAIDGVGVGELTTLLAGSVRCVESSDTVTTAITSMTARTASPTAPKTREALRYCGADRDRPEPW